MEPTSGIDRTIGLLGATSVGVGAIVGGGILALAGIAFAVAGPSAILAFALNGGIAVLTAMSFAEMSVAFPESGGTYTFAKKVLSVRTAFMIGWVVWFASIVASALYAIGFGSFTLILVRQVWPAGFVPIPAWLDSPLMPGVLALGATFYYTLKLIHKPGGGGKWLNIFKVLVFAVLVLGGVWALRGTSPGALKSDLTPFFPGGGLGLFQAMGYSFIAWQGFDLIAAVAGEIKNPVRNIPRSMVLSLMIALLIYIPLLFMVSTVGMKPGQHVAEMSLRHPKAIVALAAQTYLGAFGYWLVMAAAILCMLSALSANLFAASRVALAMSRDRTLPWHLESINSRYGTPAKSLLATSVILSVVIIAVSNIAVAGAASSLIFLLTFAISHFINILFRRRSSIKLAYKVPRFALVPGLGLAACLLLAVFQGIAIPSAGIIVAAWLIVGAILYVFLFARRAGVVDAAAEAYDPHLLELRGRSPLVLVPIANPAHAQAMVEVANALAPPNVGRIMLLSVVTELYSLRPEEISKQVFGAQEVLRKSLIASFTAGLFPEALTTVAPDPWEEISRVACAHRCESLLLGLSHFHQETIGNQLEALMNNVSSDVVILRAPETWKLSEVDRVLVPVGGKDVHDRLRARVLGSLWRMNARRITFLQILKQEVKPDYLEKARARLARIAREEVPGNPEIRMVRDTDVAQSIVGNASERDLVILGLGREPGGRRVFGKVALRVAQDTKCAMLMISLGA